MVNRRYAHIGVAVGVTIMAAGAIVFRDSEAAVQVIGMIGFFSAFVVFHALDERSKRRDKRPQ